MANDNHRHASLTYFLRDEYNQYLALPGGNAIRQGRLLARMCMELCLSQRTVLPDGRRIQLTKGEWLKFIQWYAERTDGRPVAIDAAAESPAVYWPRIVEIGAAQPGQPLDSPDDQPPVVEGDAAPDEVTAEQATRMLPEWKRRPGRPRKKTNEA